jgi:hypothetical protein
MVLPHFSKIQAFFIELFDYQPVVCIREHGIYLHLF